VATDTRLARVLREAGPHPGYDADPRVIGGASVECASSRYVWYVILLLSTVNAFSYMDRMALAVLLPSIKEDLALNDSQLGLLMGLAFALFYAICGIPIARWADRGVRRNIIAVALVVWSLMTTLSGFSQKFWHLFVARIGLGAGEAGCLPPAQSILCDYVPLHRRPGIFAIHGVGVIAGTVLGMTLVGWLGDVVGWRWTFAIIGLPGIALALVVRLTLREPPRGNFDSAHQLENQPSFAETIKLLWACRTYRFLLLFGAAIGFVQYGLNQWWPSFYSRLFELSLSSTGAYLGLAIGAGSGIGLLIGGFVANHIAKRDVRLPLRYGAITTALAVPAAAGSLFVSSLWASILLVAATALLWSVVVGPMVATLYSVVRPSMRATAGAINILFTSVLGFGLGPVTVGLLSDVLTPVFGTQALRYALLAPIGALPLMVIALLAAARTLPGDLKLLARA
jgi:predicted MFS family arabinose efflux permease